MHLEEERIQRKLHGELDLPAQLAVEQHLAGCASCRRRVEEAQREEQWILDQLRLVDHPAPAVNVQHLAARAREEGTRRSQGWFSRVLPHGSPLRVRRLQWAAGILVALGAAGVAYTMPGSPVPRWVGRAIEWVTGSSTIAPESPPAVPVPSGSPASGIAMVPGESFTIRFAAAQPKGSVTVSLVTGHDIVARALNARVAFTTDIDRITIENSGAEADYEIELPHEAPRVEILVGERRLLLKEADRVTTDAPADPQARYRLSLVDPGW